jgi:hypothetical protein
MKKNTKIFPDPSGGVLKQGYPNPFYDRIFNEINHPARYPHYGNPHGYGNLVPFVLRNPHQI